MAAMFDGADTECSTLKLIAGCGAYGKSNNTARDFTQRLSKHLGVPIDIFPVLAPKVDSATGLLRHKEAGLVAPHELVSALYHEARPVCWSLLGQPMKWKDFWNGNSKESWFLEHPYTECLERTPELAAPYL